MSADRALEPDAVRRPRLLFVHAHPDDETLTTGLTMAAHASRGHDVHLLTCTLGEEGEVIPQALAHLVADRDDTLGLWRREELRAAMSVLGVAHSVLGEDPKLGIASRYRDSGMAGTPSAEHPAAFVRADLGEAADMVAAHIKAVGPDVVVTYDERGGYGHPDHIQTHRVTMLALVALTAEASQAKAETPQAKAETPQAKAETPQAKAEPADADGIQMTVPVAYCILTPRSWASEDRVWLRDHVTNNDASSVVLQQDAPYPPSVVSDDTVTHVVQEPTLVEIQSRALAQHATQVIVYDGYYALSNHITARLSGREGFARIDPVAGRLVPGTLDAPRYNDLLTHSQGYR